MFNIVSSINNIYIKIILYLKVSSNFFNNKFCYIFEELKKYIYNYYNNNFHEVFNYLWI